MQFLKSLFGSKPAQTPNSPDSSTAGWHCVDSPDRLVLQVVMSLPPESVAETDFGLIILREEKYPILSLNPSWCAGF